MFCNHCKCKIKGFSFVEISIVCFILLVLLLPIFTLISRGSSVTVRNRNEILAQQYALNIMAYCNSIPYNNDFFKVTGDEKTKELDKQITVWGHDDLSIDFPVELGETASKTITINDFEKNDKWPFRCRLITVKVEWLQPGETKTRNVTMTGMVREK